MNIFQDDNYKQDFRVDVMGRINLIEITISIRLLHIYIVKNL